MKFILILAMKANYIFSGMPCVYVFNTKAEVTAELNRVVRGDNCTVEGARLFEGKEISDTVKRIEKKVVREEIELQRIEVQ